MGTTTGPAKTVGKKKSMGWTGSVRSVVHAVKDLKTWAASIPPNPTSTSTSTTTTATTTATATVTATAKDTSIIPREVQESTAQIQNHSPLYSQHRNRPLPPTPPQFLDPNPKHTSTKVIRIPSKSSLKQAARSQRTKSLAEDSAVGGLDTVSSLPIGTPPTSPISPTTTLEDQLKGLATRNHRTSFSISGFSTTNTPTTSPTTSPSSSIIITPIDPLSSSTPALTSLQQTPHVLSRIQSSPSLSLSQQPSIQPPPQPSRLATHSAHPGHYYPSRQPSSRNPTPTTKSSPASILTHHTKVLRSIRKSLSSISLFSPNASTTSTTASTKTTIKTTSPSAPTHPQSSPSSPTNNKTTMARPRTSMVIKHVSPECPLGASYAQVLASLISRDHHSSLCPSRRSSLDSMSGVSETGSFVMVDGPHDDNDGLSFCAPEEGCR
ncbi:hypothetical protein DFS34DRAFT_607305 [Phlyctochytrium arcticum]|nr:hypothetical protein DFS34DRAFT_607305 [Phlyctochytrium arcticum]